MKGMKYRPKADFIKGLRDGFDEENVLTNLRAAKLVTEALKKIWSSKSPDETPPECSESTWKKFISSNPPEMHEHYFDAIAIVFGVAVDDLVQPAPSTAAGDGAELNHGWQKLRDTCEGHLAASSSTRKFVLESNELDPTMSAKDFAALIFDADKAKSKLPLEYIDACRNKALPGDSTDAHRQMRRNLCRLADILTPASVSPICVEEVQEYLNSHRIMTGEPSSTPSPASVTISTGYHLVAAASVGAVTGWEVLARDDRKYEDLDDSDNPEGINKIGMLPPESGDNLDYVWSFTQSLARVLDTVDGGRDEDNATAFAKVELTNRADEGVYFCVLFSKQLTPDKDDLESLAETFRELILLPSRGGKETDENINVLAMVKRIDKAFRREND